MDRVSETQLQVGENSIIWRLKGWEIHDYNKNNDSGVLRNWLYRSAIWNYWHSMPPMTPIAHWSHNRSPAWQKANSQLQCVLINIFVLNSMQILMFLSHYNMLRSVGSDVVSAELFHFVCIFRHFKLGLLPQFPAANDEKYLYFCKWLPLPPVTTELALRSLRSVLVRAIYGINRSQLW